MSGMNGNGSSPYDKATEVVGRLVGDRYAPPPPQLTNPHKPRFTTLDSLVWTIQRNARSEMGYDAQRAIVSHVRSMPDRLDDLRRYVGVWWDATAVLVLRAESRHRGERGAGPVKLAEVRSAVAQAVSDGQPPFGAVCWLDERIIAELTEWTVESLVTLANRYSLWGFEGELPGRGRFRRFLAGLRRALVRTPARALDTLGRSLSGAAWLVERLMLPRDDRTARAPWRLQHRNERSARVDELFRVLADLRRARRELIGGLVLFATAIELAEGQVSLSADGRRRYALDLAMLALEDLGVKGDSAGGTLVLETLASFLMDTIRPYIVRGSLIDV